MSSNAPTTSLSSKTINIPSYSTPSSQGSAANYTESIAQKRSGSTGSFGAGTATRSNAQGRNNQPLKKQHKAQRRARLADEDAIAESAAMKSINSRKGQTSITHLMNFSLPPRPFHQQHNNQLSHYRRRNPTWGLGSGYHAVDKARYVHANYRFIVKPHHEYHAQSHDADVHLPWDAVMQILASAETQLTNCPICLSTPVAPRMAKCGHIFCLPCLIRYMHSTDDTKPTQEKRSRWKKCPICEDSIYISETRPVRWFIGQEASMLREGGDVLLKLLIREPGSTLALPRDAGERHGPEEDIPWFHAAEIIDHARFMKGGEDYMISQHNEEIADLEMQEKEDELMFGDDTTWTKKAVLAIIEAKQRLKGLGNPPDAPRQPVKIQRAPIVFQSPEDAPEMYKQRQALQSGGATLGQAQDKISEDMKHMHISTTAESNPVTSAEKGKSSTLSNGRPAGDSFFFYNALPNFYLSPLDIRILRAAFGPFSSFPSTILPRVEHISTGHIVDDDLRKRAKYLAHLPYGCEVSFLECDWTDVISLPVLAQFDHDIGRRRKKHDEKETREERDRIRAEKAEEDKRYAAARRRRPSVVEKGFSDNDFQPLAHINGSYDSNAVSSSPPWGTTRTHSSFATLGSPGTSPDAPRTVWGTAAIAPSSPQAIAPVQDPGPPPADGWLEGWEDALLDKDDAVALVEASIAGEGSQRATTTTSSGKQKKKSKKITLMSTNARRGA